MTEARDADPYGATPRPGALLGIRDRHPAPAETASALARRQRALRSGGIAARSQNRPSRGVSRLPRGFGRNPDHPPRPHPAHGAGLIARIVIVLLSCAWMHAGAAPACGTAPGQGQALGPGGPG